MRALVFQTDFGTDDGAVSAMYGVAIGVSPDLKIYDLTHGIEPYNIWEAAYRLIQTVDYWPEGTVFVSVVDPGVGSDRKSVVAKLVGDRLLVTPDNGTLTFLKQHGMVEEVRMIDEEKNKLPRSRDSYTFYGRDLYAYVGAKLACGSLSFSDTGKELPLDKIVEIPTEKPFINEKGNVCGIVDVLDIRFGSLWTNVPAEMFSSMGYNFGDRPELIISNDKRTVYRNTITYAKSFADVFVGEPLIYKNSLGYMAVAINQGSFSKAYNVGTGNSWKVEFCTNKN